MIRVMMIHAKNCFIFITKSSVMKKIMSMLNLEMAWNFITICEVCQKYRRGRMSPGVKVMPVMMSPPLPVFLFFLVFLVLVKSRVSSSLSISFFFDSIFILFFIHLMTKRWEREKMSLLFCTWCTLLPSLCVDKKRSDAAIIVKVNESGVSDSLLKKESKKRFRVKSQSLERWETKTENILLQPPLHWKVNFFFFRKKISFYVRSQSLENRATTSSFSLFIGRLTFEEEEEVTSVYGSVSLNSISL